MALPDWWEDIEFFKPEEFDHPEKMSGDLLDKLDYARILAEIPFKISSGWRSRLHNALVGGVERSAHQTGQAVDISCSDSRVRFRLVDALLLAGFTRIGVYKRHIHVDVAADLPQGVMWYG